MNIFRLEHSFPNHPSHPNMKHLTPPFCLVPLVGSPGYSPLGILGILRILLGILPGYGLLGWDGGGAQVRLRKGKDQHVQSVGHGFLEQLG